LRHFINSAIVFQQQLNDQHVIRAKEVYLMVYYYLTVYHGCLHILFSFI